MSSKSQFLRNRLMHSLTVITLVGIVVGAPAFATETVRCSGPAPCAQGCKAGPDGKSCVSLDDIDRRPNVSTVSDCDYEPVEGPKPCPNGCKKDPNLNKCISAK